uniref:Uncharacterized protein n=1 Tax=Arundo donax TaxID=35708 RepID=A0A0A9B9Q2_ARUDO
MRPPCAGRRPEALFDLGP